jgi:hypothetical protein
MYSVFWPDCYFPCFRDGLVPIRAISWHLWLPISAQDLEANATLRKTVVVRVVVLHVHDLSCARRKN